MRKLYSCMAVIMSVVLVLSVLALGEESSDIVAMVSEQNPFTIGQAEDQTIEVLDGEQAMDILVITTDDEDETDDNPGTTTTTSPTTTPKPTTTASPTTTPKPTTAPSSTTAPSDVTISSKSTKVKKTVTAGDSFYVRITTSSVKKASTSHSSVAKITKETNDRYIVRALKAGSTTISVKLANGWKLSLSLTVKASIYEPKSVSLGAKEVTLALGSTLQLKPVLQPTTAKTTYTWSSSSKKYATVSSGGLVTAVKKGSSTIKVKTANGKSASVKVKVVDPYEPSSVSLDVKKLELMEGEAYALNATVSPSTASTTLKWSTSKSKVATVSDGLVLALSKGSATITVKTSNGKKASCKVTVKREGDQYSSDKNLFKYLDKPLTDAAKKFSLTQTFSESGYVGYTNGYVSVASTTVSLSGATTTGIRIAGPTNCHINKITYGTSRSSAISILSGNGAKLRWGYDWYGATVECKWNTYGIQLKFNDDTVTSITVLAE